MKLVDLSHSIDENTVSYKGLPPPVICDYWSREESRKFYDDGSEFQIGRIDMVANTGTYIDCPFHRFPDGRDLSETSIEACAELDAVKISVPWEESLCVRLGEAPVSLKGKAVLLHTGWDRFWGTERYFSNHPFLERESAEFLRDAGVRLVGIDSHNIDDTRSRTRPVHTTLLGSGILIVEHLCCLELLPEQGFRFSAAPPKFKGVGTFPVRAYARIED